MPLTETQVPKIALKNVNMPEAGLNKASSEATITTTTAPAVNPATPQNKNEERPRLVISAKPTRRAVPDFHCSSSSSLVSSDSENSAFSSATEPSPTIPRTFSEVNFARPLRSSRLRSILKRPRADTTDEDDNDAENSEDESDIDDSDLESAYVEDDDLGEAGPINPGEGEDEGEDEIEITLDLSDDESVASNEDLGLGESIVFLATLV
ncbi:hypothetical protein KEM55_000450 [Ascosphaera atra]|nr:hypothetical protein KEM55_000450 [Ascosphaera atra]